MAERESSWPTDRKRPWRPDFEVCDGRPPGAPFGRLAINKPMNLRLATVLFCSAALFAGCSPSTPQKLTDQLVAADKAFSALSSKEGPKAAYVSYFTSDAKILNQYRMGVAGVQDMFIQLPEDVKLTWDASFVDVSSSGDLGYSWGRYKLVIEGKKLGAKPILQMGYYVTIWKRNQLGQWKVVFMGSNPDGQK
jgi:ketosteroid isomerase-like protein